jgi:hypothetical protein
MKEQIDRMTDSFLCTEVDNIKLLKGLKEKYTKNEFPDFNLHEIDLKSFFKSMEIFEQLKFDKVETNVSNHFLSKIALNDDFQLLKESRYGKEALLSLEHGFLNSDIIVYILKQKLLE